MELAKSKWDARRFAYLVFGEAPAKSRAFRKIRRSSEWMSNVLRRGALWPHPNYSSIENEPTFLFLLTPPYSGSTAIAKVLNSSPCSTFLQEKGEAQWLVPGLSQSDRWNPQKKVDWDSVRGIWMSKVRELEKLTGKVDVVIEKSPPNMVRVSDLVRTFPKCQLVAMIRDPYANCSSILHRNYSTKNQSEEERISLLSGLVSCWIFRAGQLRKAIEELGILHFSYEEFCRDPGLQVRKIAKLVPCLEGVDVDRPFFVKDYPLQGISNQNEKQISKLTKGELEAIRGWLEPHEDLLEYFGYSAVGEVCMK